jgi:hypothetical protein
MWASPPSVYLPFLSLFHREEIQALHFNAHLYDGIFYFELGEPVRCALRQRSGEKRDDEWDSC